MTERIRYLTNLIQLLVAQEVQRPGIGRLVTNSSNSDPKALALDIYTDAGWLVDAIHQDQDIESLLSLMGDLLLQVALLADLVQTTGTTLTIAEQDTLRLGEWLLEHAPETMMDAKSTADAALTLLASQYTKDRIH